MSAKRRKRRTRLDAVVSVRCTRAERQAWERWLQKHTKGPLTLSQGMRLWANNTTGVNDPPELEEFSEGHLHEWIARLSRVLRDRRSTDTELGIAAGLVVCACHGSCLHWLHHHSQHARAVVYATILLLG